MNTTTPHTRTLPVHAAPREEHPESPETPERSGDGSEMSELARHGDPSAAKKTTSEETATGRRGSGVEWVRPPICWRPGWDGSRGRASTSRQSSPAAPAASPATHTAVLAPWPGPGCGW